MSIVQLSSLNERTLANITNFLNLIFGEFLLFGPIVRCRQAFRALRMLAALFKTGFYTKSNVAPSFV